MSNQRVPFNGIDHLNNLTAETGVSEAVAYKRGR